RRVIRVGVNTAAQGRLSGVGAAESGVCCAHPSCSTAGREIALLQVKKTPAKIGKALQRFYADYIPENHLVLDEERPTSKIYYKDTLEYCVPLLK
ncbi:MAG TPA: hypothetical protein VLE49_22425, partial [Anaerolineales bacterium]|nr:hypothetical protein [Anaerolineales bacterium]